MDGIRHADGASPVSELRLRLQKEMQDHAAVYRTQETLAEGKVGEFDRQHETAMRGCRGWLAMPSPLR